MIRFKFLVIGKYNDCDDYCYPEIIYSSINHKDIYYNYRFSIPCWFFDW